MIQEIFEHHSIPPPWGITNLVLIPKIAHPETINQFHPISLCNTLYKLVSRIIVQRLKPYMAEIINPCQAGFVSRRRISDNIILVQEVIRTLKNRDKVHCTKIGPWKDLWSIRMGLHSGIVGILPASTQPYHLHHEYGFLYPFPHSLEWRSPSGNCAN